MNSKNQKKPGTVDRLDRANQHGQSVLLYSRYDISQDQRYTLSETSHSNPQRN